MPDFERILDQLRVDMVETPEEAAWHRGYVRGKTRARREIVSVVCVIAVAWICIRLIGGVP